MENKHDRSKSMKVLLIILSLIVVLFTLTGNIITFSDGGALSLISFEGFYAYILGIVFSLYMIIKNKNANGYIIFCLFTYLWTYYLINQMIKYLTDVNIIIDPYLYIYLGSSIFLFVSLFINNKNKKLNNVLMTSNGKLDDKLDNVSMPNNSELNNKLDKNNFIFATFILGFKEVPFKSEVLLVNNTVDNSLDLIYTSDNISNKTINLPINSIKNISHEIKMRMQNTPKKVKSNETKSLLLSAVVFGGNPLLQFAAGGLLNSFFDTASNNYDKVNFNSYFEIKIETIINDKVVNIVLDADNSPAEFINLVLNRINK